MSEHRKALGFQDIINAAAMLDKMEVPKEGRAGFFPSEDVKPMLDACDITHYSRSIDMRLKIADRIGYCCMIDNLHVYIL
jgi:hypothetical protein